MTVDSDYPLPLGPPPWIIGHRGAAGLALENTLTSLRAGLDDGAVMIEVDVQLTEDGVPVLFHDWDLRRLAGRSEIIERSPARKLLEIPLPNPFGSDPQHIVSLEEALAVLPPDFPINLELKRRFHESRDFAATLATVCNRARPLLISSFDWNLLIEIRSQLPEIPLAPLGRWKAEELLVAAEDLGASSVHAHRDLASTLLDGTHLPVLAYTVNDVLEAQQLFKNGVAGVFTDTPGQLRTDLATE